MALQNPAIHDLDDVQIRAENSILELESPNGFGVNGANIVDFGNVALLNSSGVLQSSQVPDLAITETFVVADQTERLSLAAEEGDIAIQQDNDTTYIFTGGDPSNDADWSEIIFNVVAEISGADISPATVDFVNARDTPNVVADAGTAFTLDFTVSNQHKITLTQNADVGVDDTAPDGSNATLYIAQDATGGHTVNWDAEINWFGSEPSVSQTAGAVDRFAFDKIDGQIYGSRAGSDA